MTTDMQPGRVKFTVTRTSLWDEDTPPCPEARREDCLRIDERCCSHPKNIPANRGMTEAEAEAWWFSEGMNHRVENRHIMRDFPDKRWVVEMDGMGGLIDFIGTHGCIIIKDYVRQVPHLMEIEIYDGYRE